jgi:hypothetical protein
MPWRSQQSVQLLARTALHVHCPPRLIPRGCCISLQISVLWNCFISVSGLIIAAGVNNRITGIVDSEHFYRPFRRLFVTLAIFDSSARSLVMANAAVFLGQEWRSSRDAFAFTPEAADYYSQSCKELSVRLGDPVDRISDGVITTVLGFLCHDVS